ncbi:MAG: hypothetical protein AB7O43_17125 [Hyphomicrobiaceae bacterium]
MYKIFAVLGVVLILAGIALFALPREATRSVAMRRGLQQPVGVVSHMLSLAERYNAPLSILFGGLSLYYSRRRYIVERDRVGGKAG